MKLIEPTKNDRMENVISVLESMKTALNEGKIMMSTGPKTGRLSMTKEELEMETATTVPLQTLCDGIQQVCVMELDQCVDDAASFIRLTNEFDGEVAGITVQHLENSLVMAYKMLAQ